MVKKKKLIKIKLSGIAKKKKSRWPKLPGEENPTTESGAAVLFKFRRGFFGNVFTGFDCFGLFFFNENQHFRPFFIFFPLLYLTLHLFHTLFSKFYFTFRSDLSLPCLPCTYLLSSLCPILNFSIH